MNLADLNPEQRELWARCKQLWELSLRRETAPIRTALHPGYIGWVIGRDEVQDRDVAVASVGPTSPRVLSYDLMPLAVRVFEDRTGVIHYRYSAVVESVDGSRNAISGRWSETYIRNDKREWILIAVTGGPDGQR